MGRGAEGDRSNRIAASFRERECATYLAKDQDMRVDVYPEPQPDLVKAWLACCPSVCFYICRLRHAMHAAPCKTITAATCTSTNPPTSRGKFLGTTRLSFSFAPVGLGFGWLAIFHWGCVFLVFGPRFRHRPSKLYAEGIGGSWPDRCSAPSRTVIAQEARDGCMILFGRNIGRARLIKLYKFFWTIREMRWARAVQAKRTPRGYRPVKLIRRHKRVSGNRRRLRKAQALLRKRRA